MEQIDQLGQALEQELTHLADREAQLVAKAEEVNAELERIRRRRDLIQALLNTSDAKPGQSSEEEPKQPSSEAGWQSTIMCNAGKSIVDTAYEILLARGKKPMHYGELAEQVIAAGGAIPGQDPAQTLIARLSRDERFVRPERRGYYAARDHYPRAKNVGARKGATARPKSGRGHTPRRKEE